MSGPFCYVGTWKIREGQVEIARKMLAEHADFTETNEPRLIAFNFYIDEVNRRGCVVQVHPDAESMAFHMELLNEHAAGSLGWLESIEHEQYFGHRSDRLNEILAPWETDDVPVTIVPDHVAGFTRTTVR
jgi:hypothetical protein